MMAKEEKATEMELTPDEEKFAATLQAKMDGLTADEDGGKTKPTSADDNEEVEEVEDDGETQTDDGEEESESTPEDGGEEGDEGKDDKGIPDALYRAAIHQGWKPEEVDAFVKADKELAQRTFERLHESTNKISSEFARFGRTKTQQEAEKAKTGAGKAPVDLAAIKEEYGEDSSIYKTMQALLAAFPAAQPAPGGSPDTQDTGVRQIIETFFGADDMKLYGEFYGVSKDPNKLTGEQRGRRMDVLNFADDIINGAEAQGRKMDITEALERAHLVVTEPVRSEVIRKKIVSAVKKKAKGVSLKPSSTKQGQPSKAKTETDLEEIVSAKLAKTFGRK
jgi:hypothetical protein